MPATLTLEQDGKIMLPETVRHRYQLQSGVPFRMLETLHGILLVPLTDVPMSRALVAKLKEWQALDADILVTRNHDDFLDLHEVVQTACRTHPGILIIRFDNDPTRDMTPRHIVTAIARLESTGVPLENKVYILNHWRSLGEPSTIWRCRA